MNTIPQVTAPASSPASYDLFPREIQLQILCQLCNFHDLKGLLLASSSFYALYNANFARVVTAITINECRVRGIYLTHLCDLSIAYLEFWASPPSPELKSALCEILYRNPQRALILSLPQCKALRALGGYRVWAIEIGNDGKRVLKTIGHGCDRERTKRRRGYIHTEYGLLCCAGRGKVSTFEVLKTRYVRAMSAKAGFGGLATIGIDPFGQEVVRKHDEDAILWVGKAMYVMAGKKWWSRRRPSIFYGLWGAWVSVLLCFLLACWFLKARV